LHVIQGPREIDSTADQHQSTCIDEMTSKK